MAWMRAWILFGLSLSLLAVCVPLVAQEPCTITVQPGESIQAAIDAAPPGAVICLSEGTWRENLVITKEITLRGVAGGRTMIKGLAEDVPVIRIEWGDAVSGEVLLANLMITWGSGLHGHGIHIGGHARVVLEELAVEDNSLYGVWIDQSAVATVVSSVVRKNGAGGIWVGGLSRADVVDCRIVGNKGSGVAVAGSAETFLSQSLIADNEEYGITLHDRGCTGEGGPFTGYVAGRKNVVPWPGMEDGNGRGSVCPDELGPLMTEAGGALDRRPDPSVTPSIRRGLRFVIQAQGLEEMSPSRGREIMDQLIGVVAERLSHYGYTSAELRPVGHNTVEILVPTVTDPDHLRSLIGQRSILGFHKVLDTSWREADLRDREVEGQVLPALDGMEWYLVELEPLLTGEAVETAFLRSSIHGHHVALRLTPEGAQTFADVLMSLTEGARLAIVIDHVVYTAPVVTGSILTLAHQQGPRAVRDSVEITGRFTMNEAQQLAVVLRSGALPVEVVFLEESAY